MKSIFALCIALFSFSQGLLGQTRQPQPPDSEKARVFITDSQSWSIAAQSGGAGGAFAGTMAGGARPQTAEIIKTFGQRCPEVIVNNIQAKTDYIVLLDHEGGKGALRHKNKVAVFARVSGDSIVSKSTLSLGGSVQDACEAIVKDWADHGQAIRTAAAAAEQSKPGASPQPVAAMAAAPAAMQTGKISVTSTPDGADIEVDGSFVGNTPSDVQVNEGEHTVSTGKAGFKGWARKLKVSAGSNIHLNAELEKAPTP
jgi:PEGA domain-containing protein